MTLFQYIRNLVSVKQSSSSFMYGNTVQVPTVRSVTYGQRSFHFESARVWNGLPNVPRPTLKIFWFADYRPTHHFTPDTITVFGCFLENFFFFCFYKFINNLALKEMSFSWTEQKKFFFLHTDQHVFKVGPRKVTEFREFERVIHTWLVLNVAVPYAAADCVCSLFIVVLLFLACSWTLVSFNLDPLY